MAKLPNFIIIGSPKAGTTSLSHSLGAIPGVYFLPIKEAQYFDRKYERGHEWYASLFRRAPAGSLIGEGSPGYSMGKRSSVYAARIYDLLPYAKLIYMVRNPWDRIASHYVQEVANGLKAMSFDDAVRKLEWIVDSSRYSFVLNQYREYFNADQIHIIFYEDIIFETKKTMAELLRFLGLEEAYANDSLPKANARESKSVDRPVFDLLRKFPRYDKLRNIAPRSLIEKVRPVLVVRLKSNEVRHVWSQDLVDYVSNLVQQETSEFLHEAGIGQDFWLPPHVSG